MIIVLVGKSNSGKTEIAKALQKLGIPKIITYTTRPMRESETDKDYHFVSKYKFNFGVRNGFFSEWKTYDTERGIWCYGSSKESYEEGNKVIVLDPEGLESVKKLNLNIMSVYIKCKNKTLKKRMKSRDGNSKEAKRRYKADKKDFKGIESKVDFILTNDGDKTPDEVAKQVMELFKFKMMEKRAEII